MMENISKLLNTELALGSVFDLCLFFLDLPGTISTAPKIVSASWFTVYE